MKMCYHRARIKKNKLIRKILDRETVMNFASKNFKVLKFHSKQIESLKVQLNPP